MNRRKFFGMSLAAVTLAGLPEIVLPQRTLFLPPTHGWNPSQLGPGYMRECEQYNITWDRFDYRYDAIGRDSWGAEYQFHVDMPKADPALASLVISNRFREDGITALKPGEGIYHKLQLPRFYRARYI